MSWHPAARGHWQEHRTILRGRMGVSRYRLKRFRLGVHPKAKKFGGLGWVVALDLHFGRWGLGFWPIGKGHRPGLRWVPDVAPPD